MPGTNHQAIKHSARNPQKIATRGCVSVTVGGRLLVRRGLVAVRNIGGFILQNQAELGASNS